MSIQGFNSLTKKEKCLSREATRQLGTRTIVFFDGQWICDPISVKMEIGYGKTPEEAIKDCAHLNNID